MELFIQEQKVSSGEIRLDAQKGYIWRDTKLHMRQKSLTAGVGQVGPHTRSGCMGDTVSTHMGETMAKA